MHGDYYFLMGAGVVVFSAIFSSWLGRTIARALPETWSQARRESLGKLCCIPVWIVSAFACLVIYLNYRQEWG